MGRHAAGYTAQVTVDPESKLGTKKVSEINC
jgi:hypothetical protein